MASKRSEKGFLNEDFKTLVITLIIVRINDCSSRNFCGRRKTVWYSQVNREIDLDKILCHENCQARPKPFWEKAEITA